MNHNKKTNQFAWCVLVGLTLVVRVTKSGVMTAGGLFLTPVT